VFVPEINTRDFDQPCTRLSARIVFDGDAVNLQAVTTWLEPTLTHRAIVTWVTIQSICRARVDRCG
jgi:hypothetical protein